jgi:hypothetical protein
MTRAALALIGAILVVGLMAQAASAATRADDSNQAEAQRAHDTIDADHDSI